LKGLADPPAGGRNYLQFWCLSRLRRLTLSHQGGGGVAWDSGQKPLCHRHRSCLSRVRLGAAA